MAWWVTPVGVAVGFALGFALRRRGEARAASADDAASRGAAQALADGPSLVGPSPVGPSSAGTPSAGPSPREQLLAIARDLGGVYDVIAHPDDLLTVVPYQQAVRLLASDALSIDDVFGYLVGDNSALACAAAEATRARPELVGAEETLVPRLDGISVYARTFLLRTIARSERPGTALDVLLGSNGSWSSAMGLELLRGYLREHLDAEHAQLPATQARFDGLEEMQQKWLENVLEGVDTEAAAAVRERLRGHTAAGVDRSALRGFAQVLGETDLRARPLPCATQQAALAELQQALRRDPPRSLLLVGPRGVGKATLCGELARELVADGWTVFVAGAAQLLAGQSYVGQLEQRVLDLVRAVGKRPKVLWVAPELAEFLTAGRTMQSPTGLLDLLMPHLVAGDLRILAPLEPAAVELLQRQAPLLRTASVTVRLPEASSDETLALGRAWLRRGDGPPLCDDDVLLELFQRSQQHVVDQQRPGSLLSMLSLLAEQVVAPDDGQGATAGLDDVITLVSRMTGLPPVVLDERDGLDLESVRRAFASRVMGQPEAVDCLVERIAMLKAGLCDPRRPVGVFLFTGPTGTGKTELCRALAAYLFGSEDRLLRLDMSEFQQADAIARITGDGDDVHGRRALVHEVREQPFSVVLLDEIEKAHPLVFDLFLQVFDEGRLTDRRGRAADFRHTIVILTSNLGVKSLEGAGLGFGGDGPDLNRALEEVFRREFLNRIDRVVVFRSLDRETLRDVLHKELDLVLQRRGLKSRPWAVEWDESALQFLLAQGYSTTLGARPLRRAIERHVLAPLASAIVTDRTPAGDQFLFVRSDGKGVQVEFVDPDAEPAVAAPMAPADRSLQELACDGVGRGDEALTVERELEALRGRVAGEAWQRRKADAYAAMGAEHFWTSEGRHAVLGLAELKSRIEEALVVALARAQDLAAQREHLASEPLRRLAARAWLLRLAVGCVEDGGPHDAYLQVAAVHDPNGDAAATRAFAREVLGMYRSWAARRGMQWRVLDELGDGARVAVTGFGAWPILRREAGLHVFEGGPREKGGHRAHDDPRAQRDGRPDDRARPSRVRVTVVAQPSEPVAGDAERQLVERLLQPAQSETPVVVRRYRRAPSPEVRDRVRGWRTGRLDRVLDGEFDVIS